MSEIAFMKLIPLIIILAVSSVQQGVNIQQDLKSLDAALEMAQEYDSVKESRISTLEAKLGQNGLTNEQAYEIYGMIYDETVAYQFDRATAALDQQERLAEAIGDRTRMDDVLIRKAMLQCTSGMYLESQQISERIDTTRLSASQMLDYFEYKQRFLTDYLDFSYNPGERDVMAARAGFYRGKLIELTSIEDPRHHQMEVQELINLGYLQPADSVCDDAISRLDKSSHEYAIITYYKAVVCREMGRPEEMLHWYLNSAIADVKSSVKDNASLFSSAQELFSQDNDVERAFKYTQISLDDALFFNSKLRPWQIARSLPAIENAYNAARGRHEAEMRRNLITVAILLVILFGVLCLVVSLYGKQHRNHRQMLRLNEQIKDYSDSLAEANEKLQEAIANLSEANAAKEEYIGLFLSMCSSYIDKLKKHTSISETENELKTFYKTFDNAFLQLYPNFVSDFNALLKPEARIELKKDEMLNTELRIFALIRLGITQSSHIASLLRYSVNTIYNYRAQVKNSALEDRDNFEEKVKIIGGKR